MNENEKYQENKTVPGPGLGRGPGPGGRGPGGMHMGAGPVEKRPFKKGWGKLISYCRPYILIIIIAIVCAVGGSTLTIIGPDRISEMTNLIASGLMGSIDLDAVVKVAWVLVGIYGASVLLTYVQGFIMATVTQNICKSLRTSISKKINTLPLRYFDSTNTGDILSRVTNDVDTIGQTLNQSISGLIAAITLFFGSVYMMLRTNATLALVAMGASLLGFIFMMIIVSRSQKYFTEQQKQLGKINGHVEEIYSGHNIVVAYNAEEEAQKKFRFINEKLYQSAWKSQFMSGLMMPLMNFIGNLGYVAVCVVGALLVMNGNISFGVIVAFMLYVRLFSQPLSQFAQSATSLQATNAASFRVFEFLEQEDMPDESGKTEILENANGNVEFKNVRFGYSPDKTVINDFSASVKAGQKIAIVGPTGAGKTTMVNLLMRFYDTDSGSITIDGVPVSSLTRDNVHRLFCMVLQDTWLFEGTIKENIIYSKEGVSDEEVVAACKAVGVHHFIKTLPDGYDTVLSDSAGLSGGQKQLITIARAMIENAPMLILDEATSSVDTRTEALIQNAMDKLMAGRTSFVIAHRLSTIKNADLILVMNEGDIIESGNHKDLLAQGGFYARLYNSQFDPVA
ncbi:MAG: ABC transporter ATP-binding protein [Clostridia bacterium]|nr:ABC transporter ATP-binding protein [Clostridia bacterium]